MTRLGAITIGREITMSTIRQKNVRNIWAVGEWVPNLKSEMAL